MTLTCWQWRVTAVVWAMWQRGSTAQAPVSLGWKEGRLTVEGGGRKFTGTLDLAKGTYTFTNEASEPKQETKP